MIFSVYVGCFYVFDRPKMSIRREIFFLLIISFMTTSLALGWESLQYYIDSLAEYRESLPNLREWTLQNLLILVFIFLSVGKQIFSKKWDAWTVVVILTFVFIWIVPQKHFYFLASFAPILILVCTHLLNDLYFSKLTRRALVSLFAVQMVFNLFYSRFDAFYRGNQAELVFINQMESFLKVNNYTYMDGVGILPRSKNIPCFISPQDQIANNFCRTSFEQQVPDVIVQTQRLLQVIPVSEFKSEKYKMIGGNVYLKSHLSSVSTEILQTIPSALLVFGFER